MPIPGQRRSLYPDQCGIRASKFAEAIRHNDMTTAWHLLSKESKGVRQGIWATQNEIDLQLVYRAAYDTQHYIFPSMMADFRSAVLKYWPLEDLSNLGMAPTSYIDDQHAFAFLPVDVFDDHEVVCGQSKKPGLIIPMLLEDGEWKVDLPGWRFVWQ